MNDACPNQRRINTLWNHIHPQQTQLTTSETSLLTASAKIWYNKPKAHRITPAGKAVLITGASGGLGALTSKLLQMDCIVFATDLNMPILEKELAGVKRNDNKLFLYEMDVAKEESVKSVADQVKSVLSDLGITLHAIVNNAGIGSPPGCKHLKPLVEYSDEEMQVMFQVNTFGIHRVTREFYPLLTKVGQKNMYNSDSAVVVNIASIAGLLGLPYFSFYCSSKSAAISYSDTLRRELQTVGIRVSCLEPGFTRTNIIKLPTVDLENTNEFTSHMKRRSKIVTQITSDSQPVSVVIDAMTECLFTTPSREHWIIDQFKYKAANLVLANIPSYVTDKLLS